MRVQTQYKNAALIKKRGGGPRIFRNLLGIPGGKSNEGLFSSYMRKCWNFSSCGEKPLFMI
jgi:hypothetical protein